MAAMTPEELKVQAEYTREMTAKEYLQRQRANQYYAQMNALTQGGLPNTTTVDTDGMVREIARLRKLVDPEGAVAKIQALPKFMIPSSGCTTLETVRLKDVLEILR